MPVTFRSRKEAKHYERYMRDLQKRNVPCEFCTMDTSDEKFIAETDHFKIIRNIMGYSLWDDQGVVEHLLLVPKKHTDTISEFPKSWAAEYFSIIAEYESRGFSIYARPPRSQSKSVPHQHTHLIKGDNRKKKLVVYAHKPNVRIAK